MRCPKCGKDVELQKKQVGVDENGKPIFNEYAICRDCKKQWNLDKQRAKKAAETSASNHTQAKENAPVKPVVKSNEGAPAAPVSAQPAGKKVPEKKDAAGNTPEKKNVPKRRTVSPDGKPVPTAQKAAAPSAKPAASVKKTAAPAKAVNPAAAQVKKAAPDAKAVPVSKAAPVPKPVPEGKQAPAKKPAAPAKKPVSGSGTGPVSKTGPDGRPVPRKRPVSADTGSRKPASDSDEQRYSNIPPEKVRVKREKAVRDSYEDMLAADPDRKPVKKKRPAPSEEEAARKKPSASDPAPARKKQAPQPVQQEPAEREKPNPKFRLPRIIFGIISIVAFGFFAYKALIAGLNNISDGNNATTGTVYIVLALCMLVSGLLLLIMQKKRTIFAFLLPLIFYVGGAVFAFLKRGDDKFLLYGAIASGVLAVIFLILTIAAKRSDDEYDYDDDDYDDPFDEEHDNY